MRGNLTLSFENLMELLERVRAATVLDLVEDGHLGQEEGIMWIDGHQVAVKQDPEKENLALLISVEPTSEEGT